MPNRWETVVCPTLVGRAGQVAVELRGIEAQFSRQSNVRCLLGIELNDFALLLQMETKLNLLRVQSEKEGRRIWCEGCKATLSTRHDLQSCEFTVSPQTFADFQVNITMPGVLCEFCGRANYASQMFRPANKGDLLGRDLVDALEQACQQIEF